jgi:hypothetical protein
MIPDCAEPVIGRRFAPTRRLHPGYDLIEAIAIRIKRDAIRDRLSGWYGIGEISSRAGCFSSQRR